MNLEDDDLHLPIDFDSTGRAYNVFAHENVRIRDARAERMSMDFDLGINHASRADPC